MNSINRENSQISVKSKVDNPDFLSVEDAQFLANSKSEIDKVRVLKEINSKIREAANLGRKSVCVSFPSHVKVVDFLRENGFMVHSKSLHKTYEVIEISW